MCCGRMLCCAVWVGGRLDVDALRELETEAVKLLPEGDQAAKAAVEAVNKMDNVEKDNVERLIRIGERLAEKYFRVEHLKDFLSDDAPRTEEGWWQSVWRRAGQ